MKLLSFLRARFGHLRTDADLEEEMRIDLELQAEENEGRGLGEREAKRQARVRFGGTRSSIERVRDLEPITLIESTWRDVVLGLRELRKNPVFSIVAVLTLGIGIGANTAVFTLLYGFLLRSLPVSHPNELALIGTRTDTLPWNAGLPWRTWQQMRGQMHSFSDTSAWDLDSITLTGSDGALRQYNAGLVSGTAFSMLGLQPHLGRLLGPSDDVRGGPPLGWPVVLSYGFWKERFGGDVHVVGRHLRISGTMVTVAGIAPPGFRGIWPGLDIKLYLPIEFISVISHRDLLHGPDSTWGCTILARLSSGATPNRADAEVKVHEQRLLQETIPLAIRRQNWYRGAAIEVRSGRTGVFFFGAAFLQPLYLMQGLVGIVLLLCSVNVGGLMMSRVYTRQREFAVRTALGAARWRLIRQYLTESLLIALAGGALGAVAAWYGSRILLPFFRDPMMFEPPDIHPDYAVFLITGAFAVLTTLFFGTVPAWRAGRSDPAALLTTRAVVGGRRQIAGRAFVPLQVAMSLVLVATATLLSQSLVRLRSQNTGFELDHVTIQTPPFYLLRQKGDALLDVYQRMVDRLDDMPGMRSAAVTYYTPMTGSQAMAEFAAANTASPQEQRMAWNEVGPGYFRTMQTRILAGREFQRNERRRDVCVVNESAAAALFPHEQALGQYVRSSDKKAFEPGVTCRVIGIAQDARFASLREPPPRTVYFPVSAETVNGGVLVFLMNANTEADAIAGYRRAITEIAPTVPLVLFVTMKEQMDAALGSQRLITLMSNFFAGLALFLSAIGLYGLLSSGVAQRTNEIGVRISLGAQRGAVLRMILSEAFRLLGAGMLLGGIVLLFTLRFVESMLFGVTAFDPATLAGTIALLAVVALLAAMFPALRAASVDPLRALRAE